MTTIYLLSYLDDHGALEHFNSLEQTALGGVVVALLGLIYFLIRKVVGLANHHSTLLERVIQGNTSALTKLSVLIDERLPRK